MKTRLETRAPRLRHRCEQLDFFLPIPKGDQPPARTHATAHFERMRRACESGARNPVFWWQKI